MSEAIRVLVVEDDQTQRELLVSILGLAGGIEVCEAEADGAVALELARDLDPDLILLDLFLPGISGMELLRRYRRGGGKAKVLVTTRATGQEVSDEALATGADYFLVKPVNYEELIADIRMLCDGIRRRCEELLLEMGAEETPLGFGFAARAAAFIATRKPRQMKEVYHSVAMAEHTSYDCVEKNIRVLVKQVWALDREAYRRVTGLTRAVRRPKNTDFLKALAQAAKIPL